MKLYYPEQGVTLSDFYTKITGPMASSGSSKILRNPVLKYVFLLFSAFLPTVPQEPDPFYYGEWQIL